MVHPVATAVGRALRVVFAGLLVLRHPKPIHARGAVFEGTVTWRWKARSGIRWIDEPPTGPLPVVARASRSVGLPAPLPDVDGLAIRFEDELGAPCDIELASTGLGMPSRYMLWPHRSPSRANLHTLLPYDSPLGSVQLCARTLSPSDLPSDYDELGRRLETEPWRLRLYWARPRGKWHPFAELELRRRPGPLDRNLRFDAVRHPIPGAGTHAWVAAVRQPTYHLTQGDDAG
ncbi:MAG TPA: hypothetical protein VN200_07960 [Rhodoglobus sp.]|nr:hypothetical protein [Rhodoglobus sp.]